jgi:CheY-like chemotaxis protein
VLKDLEVEVEMCVAAEDAHERLSQRKFDAILVDCNADQRHVSFVQNLRSSSYNRRAVVLAVAGERAQIQQVREAGAHFIVENPVSIPRLTATMRAARNLMARERRRAFRRSVQTLVSFTQSNGQRFDAFIADLGQTGMAIRSTETLFEKGNRVSLRFHLPATEIAVEVHAKVVRSNDYGQTGFQFTSLPSDSERHIQDWLRERRRSLREPVREILAECSMQNAKDFSATVLNVSCNGAAIRCLEILCPGTQLKMRMSSKGTQESPEVRGTIMWTDRSGRAGVKFVDLSSDSQQRLAGWMSHVGESGDGIS